MILAWLLLLTGLTISAVAIYYSVVGLTAIFAAAAIPIIVMGTTLEVAKLVCASWLKANWDRAPLLLKSYMSAAVVVLMIITSMGIFGFLSKAHSDQSLVSGDVQSKIAVYDEKIKTAKDNIDANRKALKQMDESVDQSMARSADEKGADKAVALRRSQAKERARLQSEIQAEQKAISALNDERAPIAAEVRKVEAEVGPLKYIAAFVYGSNPDSNMLEKAVTWVIILIVVVFDPLAVIMLLGAQMTFAWHNKGQDPLADEVPLIHTTVPVSETEVTTDSTHFDASNAEFFNTVEPITPYHIIEELDEEEAALAPDVTPVESELDQWNRMIEQAEAEVAKTNAYDTISDRLARGESFVNSEGTEEVLEVAPEPELVVNETPEILAMGIDEVERPGDYLPDTEESKKKSYMTRDSLGKVQVKHLE